LYPIQYFRFILLEILTPLGILTWGRSALFVCLVYWIVLVEDVEALLTGGELDGQHALAVVDGFGSAFPELCALAVRSAVLV
jgi:hypothetical protein